MQTRLTLYHVPKQHQKLAGDVSWITVIRKDATVRDSHVADKVKYDTLCPNRMPVLPPVGRHDFERSNIKGKVGVP